MFGSQLFDNKDIKITSEDNEDGGRTLTVCLMGTASRKGDKNNTDYYPDGELVAATLDRIIGEKNIDYAYANGPGTDAPDEYAAEDEYENGARNDRNERWVKPTSSSHARQMARGDGIKENIKHVLAVINGKRQWWPEGVQRKQPLKNHKLKPITKVNFVGWSRGAAAAIDASNQIYALQQAARKKREKLKGKADWSLEPVEHIKEINICAIDPVAGFSRTNGRNTKLSPLVKNYLGIYALDERSFGFSPIFPKKDPKAKTNMEYMFFPGNHRTVAGSDRLHNGDKVVGKVKNAAGEDVDIDLSTVGKVVRDASEKFLLRCGTRLDTERTYNYTREQLLDFYETIKINLPYYERMRDSAYSFRQLSDHHRKFIVHDNIFNNVAGHQLPAYVNDQMERKNGYVNTHHAQLVRDKLQEKYGKYARHIEHLNKIKYQIEVYKHQSNIEKKTYITHSDGGFIGFLKNSFNRKRIARKAACETMIGKIDGFIKECDDYLYNNMPHALEGKHLENIFLNFSSELKLLAKNQIAMINKERNNFQSDYALILNDVVLRNAPWTQSPSLAFFTHQSKLQQSNLENGLTSFHYVGRS